MKLSKKIITILVIFTFAIPLYIGFVTLPLQNINPTNPINNSVLDYTSKIDPYLLSMINSGAFPYSYSTNMIIMFRETDFVSGVQALNSMFPDIVVKKVYDSIPAMAVESPLSNIQKIASLPQVSKVWYDYPIHLQPMSLKQSDTYSKEVAYDTKIQALWDKNLTGNGIIIALLDSGIDTNHPDLGGNSTTSTKVLASVSMVEYDPYPFDFNGHGTYVAGIIAGTGNASDGKYKGIAPQAQLLNVKVFDVEGLSFYSWVLSGVEWSVSHGADIIVVPFAGPGYPDDPLCTAVDKAVESGVIVIAAAGDDGPAYTSVGSPGMALSPITVGAFNTSSGLVCFNSSRGPSLYMWMDPDIVAPGYNITSCKASYPNLGLNISFPSFPIGGFGTPLSENENYTTATGTFAAAGYVAGAAALLLQAFPFLSPEALRVGMMKTAIDLGEDPNTQGAGLLDANATYNYLENLEGPLGNITRVFTPALPYIGFFFTNDTTSNLATYCVVGTYGTFVGMLTQNTTSNFNSTHLLQGRFGVKYNGSDNVTLFLLTTVYREMHSTTIPFEDYQRALTVLGNENILIVISVDCWNSTNATGAFRITVTLINIGSTVLTDVSLLTCFSVDLFLNESSYTSADHAEYDYTDDLIYANNTYDNVTLIERIYVGFKGNTTSAAHEVGENNTVLEHFLTDQLNNNSSHDGNVGLAMKWNLTENLNPGSNVGFMGVLGVGGNYSQMWDAINNTLTADVQNVTDLCVVNASISRNGKVYTPFPSESFILNIGNTVTNATVFFFANKSTDGSSIIYTEIFQYQNLQPFTFEKIATSWEPTNSGVYSVGWVTTELPNFLTLEQILSGNLTFNMSETYLFDNFIARNVFVGTSPDCITLFPTSIPHKPFELNFPLDFAYFNLTIVSSYTLENVQVAYHGNATQLFNGAPIVLLRGKYANILISFNSTYFPRPGYYDGSLSIMANGEHLGNVSIRFNLSYPEGRLFFDSIHNEIGLETWGRRLYSIYSGYFQFSEEIFKQGHDIDEIPFLTEYNSTILSFYDGILIFSPVKGFTSQENATLHSLLNNGASILICIDPENECNWTAVEMITQPYGITVSGNETGKIIITSANMSQSHPVTSNLSSIEMDSVAFLDVDTGLGAEAIANTSDGKTVIAAVNVSYGKLLVIGDSSIFAGSHINLLDNSRLAINAINWMLENRMILSVEVSSPNPGGILYIGDNLYASIHVTDVHGSDISSNLTIYTIFVLPNGTIFPMFAFHYNEGWYTTFFFTYFTNQTGDYTMIIYADAPNYTTTHYVYNFKVEPARLIIAPLFYFPQASREYAIFSFAFIGLITLIAGSAYLLERRRLHKRTLIPELSRDLRNTIRNTVNEVRAVNKEIDRELSQKDIDDFDRIRIIHEKLRKLRKVLDKAKKVAEKVGE
jgi:serine protease AprX